MLIGTQTSEKGMDRNREHLTRRLVRHRANLDPGLPATALSLVEGLLAVGDRIDDKAPHLMVGEMLL